MQNILAATDFSERSERAIRRATMLAEQVGATLSVVHVVDDDQPRRIVDSRSRLASELLDERAAQLKDASGVACKTIVALGDPFAGIVETATEQSADLVVIGSHRRQTLRDMFVGTTAERTIRSTACPILMVNRAPAAPYRTTLLTTDLSEDSRAVIERFAALPIATQNRTSIVHVYDVPALHLTMSSSISQDEKQYYIANARKKALRSLQAFLSTRDFRIARTIARRDASTPANEILAAAEDEEAELIVVGRSAKSSLVKLFIGSVAEDTLRRSEIDVLTVPGEDEH